MEPKKANQAILITVVVAALLVLLCLALLFGWFSKKEEEPKDPSVITVEVTVSPKPTPTPTAKRPSADDLKGSSDKLVYPKETSYLPDYETYTVMPESGKTTFLLYKPKKLEFTSDRILDLEINTVVTAIAKENGFTLVKLQDGVAGWVQTYDLRVH